LVYAAFPSPALVPRDVVFGRFASVGGVKDSWTVPLYILTAEFAEELPADEDPMPPDGNPHPLPGNLQPMNNMFVPPQYPEIGWNMVPMEQGPMGHNPMGHNDHHDMQDEGEQQQQQEENQDEDEQEAESMILVPSDISGDSVNIMQENQVVIQFMQHLDCPVIPHQIKEKVVFGPILPPDMQWAKLFEHMIPKLLSTSVPLALQLSPFIHLKRSWDCAFLFGKEGDWCLSKGLSFVTHRSKCSPRRNSATRNDLLEEKKEHTEVLFQATPLVTKRQRPRKVITPLVQSNERRFTRSCLKDGYRPTPVLEAPPRKKAKGRAKLLAMQDAQQGASPTSTSKNNTHEEREEGFVRTPATPIHVLQRIGRQLGIPEENLTKDKLEAAPKKAAEDKSDNV
jgi:hypothetical protein